MAEYLIKGETLTAVANHTRKLANITDELTLEEIVYWLGRVVPLVQGHASSELTLIPNNYESSAIGVLSE